MFSLWIRTGLASHVLTLMLSWLSLCIWRHCPRYIKLSLILPASANVAPAVFAFRARSEPVNAVIDVNLFRQLERLTRQVHNGQMSTRPSVRHPILRPFLYFDAEEAVGSRANAVTAGASNSSFDQASLQDHQRFFVVATQNLP